MAIDEKEFMHELIFCLKRNDIIKAKALLQFASDSNTDAAFQQKVLTELAKGPEKMVYSLLNYLTKLEITNPRVQESLYGLILDKSYGNTDLILQYISDKEKTTRLLFIKAAGDLFLTQARPILEKIMTTEADPHILLATVQSLGNIKHPHSLSEVAAMAKHPDKNSTQATLLHPNTYHKNIIVVDNSKMMLRLYQTKLSRMGLPCIVFDRPEDAILEIFNTRPGLVITDLNMPNISGLELTRKIRKKYSVNELPIVMITAQKDVVEKDDPNIHFDTSIPILSDINRILHKPFTNDAFKKMVSSYIAL